MNIELREYMLFHSESKNDNTEETSKNISPTIKPTSEFIQAVYILHLSKIPTFLKTFFIPLKIILYCLNILIGPLLIIIFYSSLYKKYKQRTRNLIIRINKPDTHSHESWKKFINKLSLFKNNETNIAFCAHMYLLFYLIVLTWLGSVPLICLGYEYMNFTTLTGLEFILLCLYVYNLFMVIIIKISREGMNDLTFEILPIFQTMIFSPMAQNKLEKKMKEYEIDEDFLFWRLIYTTQYDSANLNPKNNIYIDDRSVRKASDVINDIEYEKYINKLEYDYQITERGYIQRIHKDCFVNDDIYYPTKILSNFLRNAHIPRLFQEPWTKLLNRVAYPFLRPYLLSFIFLILFEYSIDWASISYHIVLASGVLNLTLLYQIDIHLNEDFQTHIYFLKFMKELIGLETSKDAFEYFYHSYNCKFKLNIFCPYTIRNWFDMMRVIHGILQDAIYKIDLMKLIFLLNIIAEIVIFLYVLLMNDIFAMQIGYLIPIVIIDLTYLFYQFIKRFHKGKLANDALVKIKKSLIEIHNQMEKFSEMDEKVLDLPIDEIYDAFKNQNNRLFLLMIKTIFLSKIPSKKIVKHLKHMREVIKELLVEMDRTLKKESYRFLGIIQSKKVFSISIFTSIASIFFTTLFPYIIKYYLSFNPNESINLHLQPLHQLFHVCRIFWYSYF